MRKNPNTIGQKLILWMLKIENASRKNNELSSRMDARLFEIDVRVFKLKKAKY